MFLLPVEEPPTSEYLFISLNDKSIHRFINQSVNQSSTHSYSKIMNFLILIATALFTTLVSCDECMAVTGGVGHGSGTCYRGTAESGIGQTCREGAPCYSNSNSCSFDGEFIRSEGKYRATCT